MTIAALGPPSNIHKRVPSHATVLTETLLRLFESLRLRGLGSSVANDTGAFRFRTTDVLLGVTARESRCSAILPQHCHELPFVLLIFQPFLYQNYGVPLEPLL